MLTFLSFFLAAAHYYHAGKNLNRHIKTHLKKNYIVRTIKGYKHESRVK